MKKPMRNPPIRDPGLQELRDNEIIRQWINERWGAASWKDLLTKKDKKTGKKIFAGKRQLSEFLKRNPDQIERKAFHYKDVMYVITPDLEQISLYQNRLKETIELFSKHVDEVFAETSESVRRTRIRNLLLDLTLAMMNQIRYFAFTVTDKGMEMASFFLEEYIKQLGLELGRIKWDHLISLNAAFREYEKMFNP